MIGAVLTTVVGLGVASFGVVQLVRTRLLRRTGVGVVGTVIRHQEHDDDNEVRSPVIRFVDRSGVQRSFLADTRTSWRVHQVGQEVPVTYPPGRPHEARLTSAARTMVTVGLPLAVGALFAGFGLFALFHG